MNYRITYNEDLSRFHVRQDCSDGTSKLIACDIPLEGQLDGWNHQTAARQYLEHLPSDVRTIHIADEGEYSLEQLANIARGGNDVATVVSLIKEFDHDFVGKDWSDALLHGREMCVIPLNAREGILIQNLFAGLDGEWSVITKRHGQGWGKSGSWMSKPEDLTGALSQWLSEREDLDCVVNARFGTRPIEPFAFEEWVDFFESNGFEAEEWREIIKGKGFSLAALKARFPAIEDLDVFDLLHYGFEAEDGWYDNDRRTLVVADGATGFTYDADDIYSAFVLNLDALREKEAAEEDDD